MSAYLFVLLDQQKSCVRRQMPKFFSGKSLDKQAESISPPPRPPDATRAHTRSGAHFAFPTQRRATAHKRTHLENMFLYMRDYAYAIFIFDLFSLSPPSRIAR